MNKINKRIKFYKNCIFIDSITIYINYFRNNLNHKSKHRLF